MHYAMLSYVFRNRTDSSWSAWVNNFLDQLQKTHAMLLKNYTASMAPSDLGHIIVCPKSLRPILFIFFFQEQSRTLLDLNLLIESLEIRNEMRILTL